MSPGPTSLARPDARSTSAGPAAVVKPPPPRILIADDDPVICDVWTAALRRAGYRTAYARDGREASACGRCSPT
jgi:PleD family two-component response regulator